MVSSSEWHRLSDIDETARTATCSICGPVTAYYKKDRKRWHCGTKARESKKRWERQHPGHDRAYVKHYNRHRKIHLHGLTTEQADAFLAGKSCEICGSTKNLRVDHDHDTGAIRGVLCHRCNIGLGNLGDTAEGLRRALAYLESSTL